MPGKDTSKSRNHPSVVLASNDNDTNNNNSNHNNNSSKRPKRLNPRKATPVSDHESQITLDEEKAKNVNFYKIFRYFCIIAGIWVVHDQDNNRYESRNRRILQTILVSIRRIWTAFVLCTLTVGTVGSLRFWIYSPGLSLAKIICLILSVWLLSGTVSLIFLIYWQIGGKLKQHNISLTQATNQGGIKAYRLHLYMTSTLIFLILVTLIVNFNIFMAYHKMEDGNVETSKIVIVKRLFFDHQPRTRFFVVLSLLYAAFSFTGSLCIFNMICMTDGLEFKYLNKCMKSETKMNRSNTVQYLEKHSQLCSTVYQSNTIFKFYVLAQFCLLMPTFILNLYGLIMLKSMATTIDMLILISWLFICLITILTLTVPAAVIHSQCLQTSVVVYEKIDFHALCSDKRLFKLVTWFVSKTSNQPSGINVGCFFLLTFNFLLFMFSLIAIYLTLLPQMTVR